MKSPRFGYAYWALAAYLGAWAVIGFVGAIINGWPQ
jgi:hypothetical protein